MSLLQKFDKVSRQEWIAKANIDLKGKVAADELVYHVEEGISFSPFITDKDVFLTDSLVGPKTKTGIKVLAGSEIEANKKALKMLNLGAEVLAFNTKSDVDLSALFDGIYLEMIIIILYCDDVDTVNKKVNRFLKENYEGKSTQIVLMSASDGVNLRYDDSFTHRMQKVSQLLKNREDEDNFFLIIELKKDFLAQIAELRAIRKMADGASIYIVALISTASFDGSDIHPLIISNYLLMSAYMGMADYVFGVPYEGDEEIARLCLHIQNILKEESGLNFVVDPTAGSYIIEKLTAEMIAAAGS